MKHRLLQSGSVAVEQGAQPTEPRDYPLYLTSRQACAYIPVKNPKSLTEWLRRHRVFRCGDNTICRRDLDRVKRQRKARRVMHPRSLANLRPGGASPRQSQRSL